MGLAELVGKVGGALMWRGGIGVREVVMSARGFLGATALGTKAAAAAASLLLLTLSSPMRRRNLYFWTQAFPVYVHYKLLQWQLRDRSGEEREREFNKLHDKYAPHMYKVIINMGGFFLKLGQIGGTREDFVPPQFTRLLQTLQDQVPPERDELFALRSVDKEVRALGYGGGLPAVFRRFRVEVLAAASIGQCHRATLLDGREVVVKLARPKV